MDKISLVVPSKEHEVQIKEYINEHINNGEAYIHGGALIEEMPYDEWLKQLQDNSDEETVRPDWVVSSTFIVVVNQRMIGMLDIRHTLNEFLSDYGGHIGYSVRPSERNKGYATAILRSRLEYCRKINLSEVMLACYKDNLASSRVIQKCGGQLTKESVYSDGKPVQIYWINLE